MCLGELPRFVTAGLTGPACLRFAVRGCVPECSYRGVWRILKSEKMPQDVQMASPAELTETSVFSIF